MSPASRILENEGERDPSEESNENGERISEVLQNISVRSRSGIGKIIRICKGGGGGDLFRRRQGR